VFEAAPFAINYNESVNEQKGSKQHWDVLLGCITGMENKIRSARSRIIGLHSMSHAGKGIG
jgi:hypothetical protein